MNTSWIVYSPIIVTVICLLFYFTYRLVNPSLDKKEFIGALLMGGILGLGISVLVVIAQTILSKSAQGPLMLIYYAPVGFAIGEVFGVLLWLIKPRVSGKGTNN